MSVSGAPGSHTTSITHKVGVLCSLLLSCLGSSYVVLFSILVYLFLTSSICFLSLCRHSLIGQPTSRLPPSRPAHPTLRFLLRFLFRSVYLLFIFYFAFLSVSLYRHTLLGQSTSRFPPSRPAHTTTRLLIRYVFRSLFLLFIFYFVIVSFSFYTHSLIGQLTSRFLPSRPAHTTIRFFCRFSVVLSLAPPPFLFSPCLVSSCFVSSYTLLPCLV